MPIRTKYRSSIALMKELDVQGLKVWEEDGSLQIRGKVRTMHDKKMIEHKIMEDNLDNAMDINAELELGE